ncbi:hypothetical protein A3I27_02480 [Candidatus Giovannonibacteria bacterium RIFCSPLOWO2_02_FULL_43_11b]|uniref:Glycosyltransferase RgtA/B/C/D-like domain-containing protein n=1 Tax=Candidatus Giovannonibacteria bacterium RIFCSPHIGHO2_12_FULL_43_15 TaxID=1798341 RepID=A0A1F5WPQ6_9BACT|nr:MAG: hypothetical protein A3B97_01985 [Candidatus Giovannonibacteria bacterium RIFCSPHIGHO2_02_FULL_43_32]OGF77251.1 MAG: hypothetical protein A3F23_01215 [Candidatus Giovannonibacteria bacterium RIFCSPHIGHO2_12_FULL_43_15]OGF90508.1 MAG: hypothetical protein A3I27_02480 [Candidatus Giovannonibacteria bacterium RIFCSPLOWO2_02_FULL_43_11b]OGF91865.1 MAG: hypothetical protein A3H04_00820 [Candidatus Giovannonibacteria bacterium RIFCSPLOWO2_12_FULL_43_11c]
MKWVILTAFVIAVIFGSHHFLMPKFIPNLDFVYRPVAPNSNIDEYGYYGPRANSASHGDLIVSDIYLSEHEVDPALLPILNPLVMAILGFMFYDFILPPVAFLLVYFLSLRLTSAKIPSLLFAIIFIFSPLVGISIPPTSFSSLKYLSASIVPFLGAKGPLLFSRFEFPAVTFPFFILALYFLWRALEEGKRKFILAAGASFGLLFYTYLYDWATFLVSLVILFSLLLLNRKVEAKTVALILAIGFLVSIPYWLNFFALHSLAHYADIANRIGIEISHSFRWGSVWKSYLRDVILTSILFLILGKKNFTLFAYLASFLLSYFIVVNAQVILGFNPQPDHWYRVQLFPVALSLLIIAVHLIKIKLPKGYAAAFIIFFLAGHGYMQYAFSRDNPYKIEKSYAESYAWLNKNTDSGSVVASISPDTITNIALYTHNKSLLPNGGNTTASNNEIWVRYMYVSKLFGFSEKDFTEFIESNRNYVFQDYFTEKSHDSSFRAKSDEMPQELLKARKEEYDTLLQTAGSAPFRVDYLYFGPREKELSGINPAAIYRKVYDKDDIQIYEIGK